MSSDPPFQTPISEHPELGCPGTARSGRRRRGGSGGICTGRPGLPKKVRSRSFAARPEGRVRRREDEGVPRDVVRERPWPGLGRCALDSRSSMTGSQRRRGVRCRPPRRRRIPPHPRQPTHGPSRASLAHQQPAPAAPGPIPRAYSRGMDSDSGRTCIAVLIDADNTPRYAEALLRRACANVRHADDQTGLRGFFDSQP